MHGGLVDKKLPARPNIDHLRRQAKTLLGQLKDGDPPAAVDYLDLDGPQAGTVSRGIMEWVGDEVRFLMAGSGQPRPTDFSVPLGTGTLSQWRRR
jgi:hypothetical protein